MEKGIHKKILWLAIVVVVVVVVAGLTAYYYQIKKEKQVGGAVGQEVKTGGVVIPPITRKETNKEAVSVIEKLKSSKVFPVEEKCEPADASSLNGKIYLSLRSRGENSTSTGLYEFDVKDKTLRKFLDEPYNKPYNDYALSFSADGSKIAFISDRTGASQIFAGDSDGKNSKQITNSQYQGERKTRTVFSPDGKEIVFEGMKLVSGILADEWKVYLTDLDGKEEFITAGTMPLFSPDGKKMLVLRSPGVYLLDLGTKETERVIELRDESGNLILGQVNQMLSLSPGGKKLAWSNVDRGEIYLLNIVSWEPFRYHVKAVLKTIGFWNTFSPDRNYFAIQEANVDKANRKTTNQRLNIYETCNFGKVLSFDLGEFDPYAMWVTAWR